MKKNIIVVLILFCVVLQSCMHVFPVSMHDKQVATEEAKINLKKYYAALLKPDCDVAWELLSQRERNTTIRELNDWEVRRTAGYFGHMKNSYQFLDSDYIPANSSGTGNPTVIFEVLVIYGRDKFDEEVRMVKENDGVWRIDGIR